MRQVAEEERYPVDEFESVLLKDIPETGKVPCERVYDATVKMTLSFCSVPSDSFAEYYKGV